MRSSLREFRTVALLSYWKTRNSARQILTDPRKLVPILVFGSFTLLGLVGSLVLSPGTTLRQVPSISAETLRAGLAAMMAFIGLGAIDAGLSDSLLAFAMSDVDYLFPSPTSRRVIIAYRLPGLTASALLSSGFIYFIISVVLKIAHPALTHFGQVHSPQWFAPAATVLCVGTYLNLALFISLNIPNRQVLRRIVSVGFLALLAFLGFIGWKSGGGAVTTAINSDAFRWPFLPASLAGDIVFANYAREPAGGALGLLTFVYLLSLIPMFLVKTNWFEQSIVSAESAAAYRKVMRGGLTAMRAAQSATYKYKALKPYTVAPFGRGAMALFWAHLCAAAKRMGSNFIVPLLAGLLLGSVPFFVQLTMRSPSRPSTPGSFELTPEFGGIGLVVLLGFYATMIFLAAGRAASESAIKRREMLTPLPIPGRSLIVANLAVPGISFCLFSWGVAASYWVLGGRFAFVMSIGFCLLLPARTFARMTLQYLVVIGYPDFADKIQQVLANGVYFGAAFPFFIVEYISGLVAFLLYKVTGVLVVVALLQIPIFLLVLFLAGKASDRAVATGEPVNLLNILR